MNGKNNGNNFIIFTPAAKGHTENTGVQLVERFIKYGWFTNVSGEIKAIIVAPKINKNINKRTLKSKNITLDYQDKIVLFSLYYDTVVDFR